MKLPNYRVGGKDFVLQDAGQSVRKYYDVVPIFKRGSAFKANDYRRVHLTFVLSKFAKKIVALQLTSFLQRKVFGAIQWAFSTGLSARDLITMSIMSCKFALAGRSGRT